MKNIFLFSLALSVVSVVSSSGAFAQNDPKKLPSVMSPEAASLGKYGTYNVNFHTGAPNISVPLYGFEENGIGISLALSYDASGFIPNKSAGMTGLNWNLSSGGVITRVVNGEPDEKNNPDPTTLEDQQDHTNIGYIYGIQHNMGTYLPEYIRSLQLLNMSAVYSPGSNINYEYSPDIFSFNFLGHSGTFFMDNDGQMRVQSDRRYKIDMTEFTPPQGLYDLQDLLSNMSTTQQVNQQSISRIKITSDDGYVFYFGGALPTLEIGCTYPAIDAWAVNGKQTRINAWYLTRIETPDGSRIDYNYQEYTTQDVSTITTVLSGANANQTGFWNNREEGNEFFEIKLGWNDVVRANANSGQGSTLNERVKTLTKLAYLKEIVTTNKKISFLYSEKDRYKRFYAQADTQYIAYNSKFHTQKLDKIVVQDLLNMSPVTNISDGTVSYPASRYIEFSYDYIGSEAAGYRLSLNHLSVNAPNVTPQTYGFNYYDLSSFPDPMTKGLDLWGFYNGTSNTTLTGLPDQNDPEFEVDFNSVSIRTATQGTTNDGTFYPAHLVLKKITYPTGGFTEFTFENNTYRQVLKRKVSSGITPVLESFAENQIAGGLRIKRIVNSQGPTTDYYYNTDYQTTNTLSSGMLTSYEVNFLSAYIPQVIGGNGYYSGIWSDNNLAPAASYAESHIEYAQVQEVQQGNGYTNYTYSTVETNPDVYYLGANSYKLHNPDVSLNNFNSQLMRLFKYSSCASERGKLLKQEVFDEQNRRLSYTENSYNNDAARFNERGVAYYKYVFSGDIWLCHSYANYYYHNNLTQQLNFQYDPATNTTVETATTFQYKSNSNPLLVEKKVTGSDQVERITRYKYPEDYPADPVYTAMVAKFMVGSVVEEQSFKGATPLSKTSSSYYIETNGSAKLQSIVQTNQVRPVSSTNPAELMHFYDYDSHGNLLEASRGNDNRMSYQWGYNSTLLEAEVTNASSNEIYFNGFEEKAAWSTPAMSFDETRAHTGRVSAKSTAPAGPEYVYHADKWLTISLTAERKFRYSVWVYSDAPTVDMYLIMRTATETNYYSQIDVVQTNVTGKWVLLEKEVSVPANITKLILRLDNNGGGNVWFDDIRLYPADGQMTSYTYSPLAGVTSKTDVNNRTTYYEYDGFGRLSLIRDHDNNILKKICYNYAGQPQTCGVPTDPNWQNTGTAVRCRMVNGQNTGEREQEQTDINPYTNQGTRWVVIDVNCTTCPKPANWQTTGNLRCVKDGSNVNTGYQEREEKDMESCSATYNQLRWVSNGYHPEVCPPPCSPTTCGGVCINGVCDPGTVIIISASRRKVDNVFYWFCMKALCFGDGTYIELGEEMQENSCLSAVTVCQ